MRLEIRDVIVGAVLLMLLGMCIVGQYRINDVADKVAMSERLRAVEAQTIINTNDIRQMATWINQQIANSKQAVQQGK